MSTPEAQDIPPSAFVTTRWTHVLSARGDSPQARVAMGELCEAYWMPVFRFVCRSGHDEDTARDLTQGFFAQLLAQNGLDTLESGRGRFRSFLLGAVKHFLADEHDRAHAAKRGGKHVTVPLENGTDSSTSLQVEAPGSPPPDTFFDRQWALNVIDRALQALALEFKSADKSLYFETLKPWLVGDMGFDPQAAAGARLGLSEGAVKVAIHRVRKQFRSLVKAEISQTLAAPDDLSEELRYLVEVLSSSPSS
jgi:DNA-directed RNA polymerase specialized sigma24 family protein